jgi:predicted PurR-regulated permease PerM
MTRKVEISQSTILFTFGFLAFIWAIYQILEVIILLFAAIILMSALAPIVDWLSLKLKLPKVAAIGVCYIMIVVVIAAIFIPVINPLINQTSNLIQSSPRIVNQILPENGPIDRSLIQNQLSNLSSNAFTFTLSLLNAVIAAISVAVLTFYLLMERHRLDELIGHFAIGHQERAKRLAHKIQDKLGSWMRGQLILSFIIGSCVFVLLLILNIPYMLPLAILAGILEVVPTIGPIISAIPAALIAYLISPANAVFVIIGFFVIQQIENSIVVPQVMKKAVGLNPLIVILAVAIGSKLLGVMGALLAVPIAVVVQIALEEVVGLKELDTEDKS